MAVHKNHMGKYEKTRMFFFTLMLVMAGVLLLATFLPQSVKESFNVYAAFPGITGMAPAVVNGQFNGFFSVFIPFVGILFIAFMLFLFFHWKKF